MANLFESPRYIAVEGPIRVGKSTLARILGERLNAQRVSEPEDNPFLASFYEGEKGAAFQAQFAFLIRRFEQLRALDLASGAQRTVVADYIFEKDKLFACLNLSDQELETYNRFTTISAISFRPLTWSFICRRLPRFSRSDLRRKTRRVKRPSTRSTWKKLSRLTNTFSFITRLPIC